MTKKINLITYQGCYSFKQNKKKPELHITSLINTESRVSKN